VVLTATRTILKDQPVILDYNEYSSSFFEDENLPSLPRFTIRIPPIPEQVLACGRKSALASLLQQTSDRETKVQIKREEVDEDDGIRNAEKEEEEEEKEKENKEEEGEDGAGEGEAKKQRRRRTADDGFQRGRHKSSSSDPLVDVIVID
jgi:hypothetical protein